MRTDPDPTPDPETETVVVADLTGPDVRARLARGCRTAVLPVGACEQHGPHLPLGTDTYFVTEVAKRGAQLATAQAGAPVALVFPPVWFGKGETRAPGELWLRPTTLIAVLLDLIGQLDAQGFRRVVLVNGHGGNWPPLSGAVNEAQWRRVRAALYVVSPWSFMGETIKAVQETTTTGHACEIETSTSLHVFGHLVHLDRLPTNGAAGEQPDWWAAPSPYAAVRRGSVSDLVGANETVGTEHPGYVGDPTKATAEKGRRLTEAWVEGFAAFLRELHGEAGRGGAGAGPRAPRVPAPGVEPGEGR